MEAVTPSMELLSRRGLSRITEADLLAGSVSGPALRREPCACGGYVDAAPGNLDDVTEALRAHQAGGQHRRYRREAGL